MYVFEDSRNALLFADILLQNPLTQRRGGFADGSKMRSHGTACKGSATVLKGFRATMQTVLLSG